MELEVDLQSYRYVRVANSRTNLSSKRDFAPAPTQLRQRHSGMAEFVHTLISLIPLLSLLTFRWRRLHVP